MQELTNNKMAGNKLGAMKTQTGFGKKDYKPGAMISKMNKFKSMPAKEVKNNGKKGAKAVVKIQKAHVKGKIKA